jgi:hypothetical protein
MSLPYTTLELWQYKATRFITKTIYGIEALERPRLPYEEGPPPSATNWWKTYEMNQPYRERARKTNAFITRCLSLYGSVVVLQWCWKGKRVLRRR